MNESTTCGCGEALIVGIVSPEVRTHAMFISERLVAICVHVSISNTTPILQSCRMITQSACRACLERPFYVTATHNPPDACHEHVGAALSLWERLIKCLALGLHACSFCRMPSLRALCALLAGSLMRTLNPDVAKVFTLADRGMDLFKAWEKCGSPTTWGNVQRQSMYISLCYKTMYVICMYNGLAICMYRAGLAARRREIRLIDSR